MAMFASTPAGAPPMSERDLDDWCAAIDASAQADQARGVIRNGVINAGEAALAVINARRGKGN